MAPVTRRLSITVIALVMVAFAAGITLESSALAGGSLPITKVKTPSKTIRYGMLAPNMEPTIHCGPSDAPTDGCLGAQRDTMVIRAPLQTVKRFDIVSSKITHRMAGSCGPRASFIQRVIALPGETWSERNGYVYIDGKKLSEPYLGPLFRDYLSYKPRTLRADEYFLMGDNRAESCDSRRFGPLHFADMPARVVRIERPTFPR